MGTHIPVLLTEPELREIEAEFLADPTIVLDPIGTSVLAKVREALRNTGVPSVASESGWVS